MILLFAVVLLLSSCNIDDQIELIETKESSDNLELTMMLEEIGRSVSPDGSLDGSLDNIEDPSWGRDKTPITLDWYVAYDWFSKDFNPEVNLGDLKLLENTGIKLNVITGSVDELNTMIGRGELPDLITYDANNVIFTEMENRDILYPLNQLIDAHATDTDVPKSMIDWYLADDGNWYRFVSFFSSDERVNEEYGGFRVTHNGNWVRTDLLDEIGMTMADLETKEGFMAALMKIKDDGITYKGQTVTPFLFDIWYGSVVTRFAEQFGADHEDEEGNYVNVQRSPEYLEALLFLNQMYRNGLFSEEEFMMDDSQKDAKIASGLVFLVNGWVAVKYGSKSLWLDDQEATMAYGGVIQGGDNGKEPILMETSQSGWSSTVITKDCIYPDRAIQLLSYLSQEELMLDNTYGTGAYQVIDGQVIRDQSIMALEVENEAAYNEKYDLNIGLLLDANVGYKYKVKEDNWYNEDLYNAFKYPKAEVASSKAFTGLDADAPSDLSPMIQKISDHTVRSLPAIIMADTPEASEKLYHKLIDELDELGMVEYDSYRNEQFQANKKKLGIEFAWPRYSE